MYFYHELLILNFLQYNNLQQIPQTWSYQDFVTI